MFGVITRAGVTQAPDYRLKMRLRGKDITDTISKRLISLTMIDYREFTADSLKIVLDDSDGQIELPVRGTVLSLSLGWKGFVLKDKGEFTVDTVTHNGAPDTVTIVAHSADFRTTLNVAKEVSWHDTTLGDIVKVIASRNKLTPRVADELAGIKIAHIDQSQESDAVFLTRLAKRNGAAVSVKGGAILMLKAGSGKTVSGTPIPEMTIQRSDGDAHSFSIADRKAYTGVTAKWLDTKDPKEEKQKQKVKLNRKPKAPPPQSPQHPNAKALSGKTLAQKQQEQGGVEIEYMLGNAKNMFTLTKIFASEEQAKRAALAKWDELQRRAATFSITLAMGRETIITEMPVKVSGFKRVIDEQAWIVTEVTHTLDGMGFKTKVKLEINIYDADYVEENGQGTGKPA
jgi:phage protein D